MDTLSIKICIADRYYPMKVQPDEEEYIRRAAKMVNERVTQYKNKYQQMDIQDILSMAILQFAVKVVECNDKHDVNPLVNNLRNLDQQLDKLIGGDKT